MPSNFKLELVKSFLELVRSLLLHYMTHHALQQTCEQENIILSFQPPQASEPFEKQSKNTEGEQKAIWEIYSTEILFILESG